MKISELSAVKQYSLASGSIVRFMGEMLKWQLIALGCFTSVFSPVSADELEGAAVVLKEITAGAKGNATLLSPAQIREGIERFRKESADLPTNRAAAEWLDLFEAARNSKGRQGKLLEQVFAAAPPVEKWDALVAEIARRTSEKTDLRNRLTAALGVALESDRKKYAASVAELFKELSRNSQDPYSHYVSYRFPALLVDLAGTPAERITVFREIIGSGIGNSYFRISVPDFSAEKDAGDFAVKIINGGISRLEFKSEKLRKFIVETALKRMDEIKTPPWGLVTSERELDLLLALHEKFPRAGKNDKYERGQAFMIGLTALAGVGKFDEADKFAGLDEASHYQRRVMGENSPAVRKNLRDYAVRTINKGDAPDALWMMRRFPSSPEKYRNLRSRISPRPQRNGNTRPSLSREKLMTRSRRWTFTSRHPVNRPTWCRR